MRDTVAIGFLGTVLDRRGHGAERWKKWRPSVGICAQPQMPLRRLELLHDNHHLRLAQLTAEDIAAVSPDTEVRLHAVNLQDPWDFEEMYATLHDFAARYPFDTEREDYLVHITTGTHVAQICWFLLAESRHLPARLLQNSPARQGERLAGEASVIDLDLSRYDQIAQRSARERRYGVLPQGRHRHPQSALQPHDRTDRAGGDAPTRPSCSAAPPAPARASWRAGCTS